MSPETRYARATDGTHIAYQAVGDGPVDILVLRAWHSNVEHEWAEPVLAGIYRRLASVGRVLLLDRRGTGLSAMIGFRLAAQKPPEARRINDDVIQRFDHIYEVDPAKMTIIEQQDMPAWDTLRIVDSRWEHLAWMHAHWADSVLTAEELGEGGPHPD